MGEEFDIAAAVSTFVARERERKGMRLRLHEKASGDCARILEMAVREFGPKRVYQWGSLLNPDEFDENSDIDIAVEGLGDAHRFLDLLGRAMDLTVFPVDLVEWEKLDPEGRASILSRGKVVYGRSG